jgi:hypothetical protein
MKFINRVKKHQWYLYISIFLVVLFFVGNALITPKITSVTEHLIDDIVQGNLKSKENIVAFEFNQLNRYLVDSEKIIGDAPHKTIEEVKGKLIFSSDLAIENPSISNSFVAFLDRQKQLDVHFSKANNLAFRHAILDWLNTIKEKHAAFFIDQVVVSEGRVFNRKIMAKLLDNGSVAIIGFDIDLYRFWDYYSEQYKGEGGYTVVANAEGVCLLHPETQYIGKKLDGFFNSFSVAQVLRNSTFVNGYFSPNETNLLKEKAISSYLGLEVLRYYDTVKVGRSSLIVIVSYPVDIYLKEHIVSIKKYFSWMTVFAFCTFMLLLLVSRFQLRKEFMENLKVVEEKEDLMRANEKFQRENAVLQLNQLKKKMNPHFLFNSLNSLHVLIDSNPELSQQFVLKLAEVYRYLLEEREAHLVTVKKELEFLRHYVFLQEIRFSTSLKVLIRCECDDKILLKKIPFLSLETLVENAIKHNEFTKQKPLFITIIIREEEIVVSNNYAPRKHKDANSHHIGLDYLRNNYEYYQINSFRTLIVNGEFQCFLPLLS